jgi:hypothetical protein
LQELAVVVVGSGGGGGGGGGDRWCVGLKKLQLKQRCGVHAAGTS